MNHRSRGHQAPELSLQCFDRFEKSLITAPLGGLLFFADEPTGNLDSRNETQVLNPLFELANEAGKTLVIIQDGIAV